MSCHILSLHFKITPFDFYELLQQHTSQILGEEEEGKDGGTRTRFRTGSEGGGHGRNGGRKGSGAEGSSPKTSVQSSVSKESTLSREKGHKWVEMSYEDVRVLKRKILSSQQQCEEALNKCVVEVPTDLYHLALPHARCAVLCRAMLYTIQCCAVLLMNLILR